MTIHLFENVLIEHILLISAVVALVTFLLRERSKSKKIVAAKAPGPPKGTENLFAVESVSPEFEWDKEEPLKSYPFKDKEYKLTMGIKYITSQEWLLVEKEYLEKIEEKTRITTNTHPDYPKEYNLEKRTVFESPECEDAIREFYDIVVKYMSDKYPMCFQVSEDKSEVLNKITGEKIPAKAGDVKIRSLLHYLVRTIEEDFIILLRDPSRADEPNGTEYYFKGGIFGFAAGFDPLDKFDQPLTNIHKPIPGYESKLKLSMNKFFSKLKPGEFVLRSNFSIQTHDKHYVADDNKGYHDPETASKVTPYESLDFDTQVHYRSERQTLCKLPRSQAIVFSIRTYLHPLSKFKSDIEDAKRLRGSLEKFPEELALYKNLVHSRPAVTRYLDEL